MRGLGAPLRAPGFARLLLSYTVNEIGDSIGLVALSVLVFDRTGDALATAAFFIGTKFLPAFLAPAVTARVDQLPVRGVLPGLYVAEALTFLLLSLQVESFSLVLVILLGAVDGTLALAGRGISRGAVAAILAPRGLLREGNALMNVAFGLASVTGLAAGGLLVSAASLRTALLLDAVSFLLIAILLAASRDLPRAPEERDPFLARLRGGLAYVRGAPTIRALLAWQALALLFFTIVIPIEVVYATETLEAGSAGFGALLATWSAGILVGGLTYVRIRRGSAALLVLGSTALIGVAYAGMGVVRSLPAACAFALVGGFGNGIQWVAVMTLLQEATPADLQARVSGLLESIGAAVPGVGYLLGGVLTTLASPPVAYLTAAGGVGALVLAGLVVTQRRRSRMAAG
ncbi:MAG TPA: MFS transporter [Solirubrobacteraceae bacterium]|nr:MFS transporter [Solirubrobacteraceae bacterium]